MAADGWLTMYANKYRSNRPTRLTASDRARLRARVAQQDRRAASERRARFVAVLLIAVVTAMGAYAGLRSDPVPVEGTYRAMTWDGATVARGMTFGRCMELFERPDVAGCHRE